MKGDISSSNFSSIVILCLGVSFLLLLFFWNKRPKVKWNCKTLDVQNFNLKTRFIVKASDV